MTQNIIIEESDESFTDDKLRALRHKSNIVTLDLHGTSVTSAGLSCISEMTRLRNFSYLGDVIEDRNLEALSRIRTVESITILEGPRISDDGVAHLGLLPSLRQIYLSATAITDGALSVLGGISSLTSVGVDHTRVTDAGVSMLARLPILQQLSLNGTGIHGRCFSAFSNTERIDIHAASAAVDDDAVARIVESFPRLLAVTLARTKVTDASCQSLARAVELMRLNVNYTAVTPNGLRAFYGHQKLDVLTAKGCGLNEADRASLSSNINDEVTVEF